MQQIRSSKPPVITGTSDPNKPWGRQHHKLVFSHLGYQKSGLFHSDKIQQENKLNRKYIGQTI